jgi:hypothetical protein
MRKIPQVCPFCGFPIAANRIAAGFVGKQRRLYEIVAAAGAAGINSAAIMSQLYADDPSGGPESQNIVCVMVSHINRRLAQHGLAIRGHSGHGSFYRLTALPKFPRTTDPTMRGNPARPLRRVSF